MSTKKHLSRRDFLKGAALTGAGTILAACAGPTPTEEVEAPAVEPTSEPAMPEKDKIVVGLSRPLSGWNATIGDSAFRPV